MCYDQHDFLSWHRNRTSSAVLFAGGTCVPWYLSVHDRPGGNRGSGEDVSRHCQASARQLRSHGSYPFVRVAAPSAAAQGVPASSQGKAPMNTPHKRGYTELCRPKEADVKTIATANLTKISVSDMLHSFCFTDTLTAEVLLFEHLYVTLIVCKTDILSLRVRRVWRSTF